MNKKLIIPLLGLLGAVILAAPNSNDRQLDPTIAYGDYVISESGTASDPIIVWGNGAKLRCVLITGSYIVWQDTIVEGCNDHVIRVTGGKFVTVKDNIIRNGVLDNYGSGRCNPKNTSGGWASAIKGSLGTEDLTVTGNTVYQNCGEGIALTRVARGLVENNTVYDNYSVGIYIDNSYGVTVRGNRIYSTGLTAYYRNGFPAQGILLGVENYGAWGFQFHDNLIENNTLSNVGGIRYYSQLAGTPANVTVRNNVFANVPAPVVSLPTWANVSSNSTATPTPQATIVTNSAELTQAMANAKSGQVIQMRGGTYAAPATGWQFTNSGVTLMNYPGEVVTLSSKSKVSGNYIIKCLLSSPAANDVKIIGSDVGGSKGIIMTGEALGISPAIVAYQCDNWEVSGVEFRDVGYAIFQRKVNNGNTSADGWYVHDNLVSDYFRESGMQFNGNRNRIENNRIIKQTGNSSTTYGCQILNLLGNNNVVRGNYLERVNQSVRCIGIFFEWDLADSNLIENNIIKGVQNGISFFGGDNNIIRGNTLSGVDAAFVVRSWADSVTAYPCNFSDFMPLESDTASPDWQYMYPHDCRSKGNRFENNSVSGFSRVSVIDLPEPSNVFSTPTPSPTVTPTITPTKTPTPVPTFCETAVSEHFWFMGCSK